MPKKRYTPEEIIQHLRTVELDTGKGLAVLDSCRKVGITEQTCYRWKKEYGGPCGSIAPLLQYAPCEVPMRFLMRPYCGLPHPLERLVGISEMGQRSAPADLGQDPPHGVLQAAATKNGQTPFYN